VDGDRLGVAMCFLDAAEDRSGDEARALAREAVEDALRERGLTPLGWREVPVEPAALGGQAREAMPHIVQALFTRPADVDLDSAERRCLLARKQAERRCREAGVRAYFASWSFSTVTYKALSAADQLAAFYADLV